MIAMPTYEVLSYDDPVERQKWRRVCKKFKDIDIYYYPEYSYFFQMKGDGKALCFVYYQSDDDLVIYPFLMRSINEILLFRKLPNQLTDIITPYGYGGYLRSHDRVNMENFYVVFQKYCQENNIVAEFIRFHPLFANQNYCPPSVSSEKWNDTVILDLSLSKDQLWKNMSPTCRNKVRKASKYGITIVKDDHYADLDIFYRLYLDTMAHLGAEDYYYFSLEWFNKLYVLMPQNVVLFHAFSGPDIILSAFFLLSNRYIHYFLSGSRHDMRHLGANNLLLHEVALWAKSQGINTFHLGGGTQPNDDLFSFKASFSPLHLPFFIGKIIHDDEYYKYLSKQRHTYGINSKENHQFFPTYRIPIRSN